MPPDFEATWSFVLLPVDGGRTRLVERFRFRGGEGTASSRVLGPLMGFGVFVMMGKQMLGIRDRAERLAHEAAVASWRVSPEPGGPEPATLREVAATPA